MWVLGISAVWELVLAARSSTSQNTLGEIVEGWYDNVDCISQRELFQSDADDLDAVVFHTQTLRLSSGLAAYPNHCHIFDKTRESCAGQECFGRTAEIAKMRIRIPIFTQTLHLPNSASVSATKARCQKLDVKTLMSIENTNHHCHARIPSKQKFHPANNGGTVR